MFVIGADLGQANDHTAVAVIEKAIFLDLRHLERLPLGLDYPGMADRVLAVQRALPGSKIILDYTGVGRPVADIMRGKGADLVPISITGGKKTHCVDGAWRVPKRELVRGVSKALENGLLRIAKGLPFAAALEAEFKYFEVKISERGHDSYGGKSEHDDLVIAVALAVWAVEQDATACQPAP